MKEKYTRHPLFGTNLKNWFKLLEDNKGIERGFYQKAAFVTVLILFFSPARILHKIIYGKKIRNTTIKKTPVFIIGHWRSGTTFLHELMCMDPNLSYISLWHTLVPDSFLVLEPIKTIVSGFLPRTRPMDEIKVEIDGPYEEEAALSTLLPWSYFHCFIFPKKASEQFQRSVLFKDLEKNDVKRWKQTYQYLIKAVSYQNKQKRLIIKSPSNTARINTLLEIFPDARFIHIYRNPYEVYKSTMKMRKNVLDQYALQNTTEEEIRKLVLENYSDLFKEYYNQKNSIPNDRLIEVRYEDLVLKPMKTLEEIYEKIDLEGFNEAKPFFQKYLDEKKEYKTNKYVFDKKSIDDVEKNWDLTIKKWKYNPPE